MKEGNIKRQRRKGSRKSNKKMKKFEMPTKNSKSPIFGIREDFVEDNKEQYLFLLEFCILRITGKRLAKLNQMFFVPTSVGLEFLHFTEEDNIEITPVDLLFKPQAGIADDVEYFYSGKSVMFAMDHETTKDKSLELTVRMTIRKRMPEGIKPDILVGVAEFELTKQFAALRKEMLQCWHRKVPPPKTFEDSVPLIMNEEQVGKVFLYVRMSAFGETIVTEFEAPESIRKGSAYVFKGEELNEKSLAYKCRAVDSENVQTQESIIDFPCRACVLKEYDCLPCGRPTGARAQDHIQSDDPKNLCLSEVYKPASYPPSMLEDKSKKDFCNDINKSAGPIQTSRGPVQACGKAVILKVSGLLSGETNKQPTVTVSPECDATGPPDRSPDPEHDVFILRIGKKGLVGVDEKSDLQLEMKTPKGPERRPPIRYETRQIQTDIDGKKKRGRKRRKKKK